MEHDILDLIRRDPRYAYEAYDFVCDAVEYTQEMLGRSPREDDDPDGDYHISAEELVRGCIELAVFQYGMLAPLVFERWGLLATDDIGHVVFNLISVNRLSQSERDQLQDFHQLLDLKKELRDNFRIVLEVSKPGKARK